MLETSDFLFDTLLVLEFLDALFFEFAITISFLNPITGYRLMPQTVSGCNYFGYAFGASMTQFLYIIRNIALEKESVYNQCGGLIG